MSAGTDVAGGEMTAVQSVNNSVGDQPGGAQLAVEDIGVLLGAIISERLLGAERRLENGAWQWSAKDEPAWLDTPPLEISDQNIEQLMGLLDNLRHGHERLNFVVGTAPPTDVPEGAREAITRWYRCEIRSPADHSPLAYGTGEMLCAAIAVAVCRLTGANIPEYHRVLFPHRYLAGVN